MSNNPVAKIFFFFSTETKAWKVYFEDALSAWKMRMHTWVLDNDQHPVHVVRYEDLLINTVGEVEKILDFLQFPYVHEDLVHKLEQNLTEFQRSHSNDDFHHFSPEQKSKLRIALMATWDSSKEVGKADLLRLDEYIEALDEIH